MRIACSDASSATGAAAPPPRPPRPAPRPRRLRGRAPCRAGAACPPEPPSRRNAPPGRRRGSRSGSRPRPHAGEIRRVPRRLREAAGRAPRAHRGERDSERRPSRSRRRARRSAGPSGRARRRGPHRRGSARRRRGRPPRARGGAPPRGPAAPCSVEGRPRPRRGISRFGQGVADRPAGAGRDCCASAGPLPQQSGLGGGIETSRARESSASSHEIGPGEPEPAGRALGGHVPRSHKRREGDDASGEPSSDLKDTEHEPNRAGAFFCLAIYTFTTPSVRNPESDTNIFC